MAVWGPSAWLLVIWPVRSGVRWGSERLASRRGVAGLEPWKAKEDREMLPFLQARRADRNMNHGIGQLAANSPDLAPITEVAFVILPAG